jgi:hypothetical protein
VVERFAANGLAVYSEHFPFFLVVPEVSATRAVLLPVAAALAPAVAAVFRCVEQPSEGELNLAVGPVLRGIYESDLRPIQVTSVELVEVFVALVCSTFCSNRFWLICLSLSKAAETMPRQQSAVRKLDYRD